MKSKYLLAGGVPLILSGALLVGCNQNDTSGTAPQTAAKSDAPEGSSADEAKDKNGGHHADAADESKAHSHSTKLEFSSEPNALPVGKAATWTLQINDAQSGQPVGDFDIVHDKLMHLIVVKKDLTWFNHIHPVHKGNGKFVVTAALPTAGEYKLYADYTPKGKAQEVPSHEFATVGTAPAAATKAVLVPDKMQGAWMTKKVIAHPEGQPGAKGGATYEVALMPMPSPLKAGEESMLHFQVRDASGKPIKDLQPYLGAMGHAVILSSDTESYLHSHPMEGGADHDMSKMGDMKNMKHSAPPKSGGPDVMFHTTFPTAGLYKAWGQFMHKGKIITAAFVVNVGAGTGKPATTTDESKTHAH